MIPADMNHCFRRNEQIIYRELDGTGVLIDPYRRTLVRLNPVGSKIWQLLDGSHSVAAINEELENEFEVDPEKLDKDVRAFLKGLFRREMIK